jgi:hypothetical protein
VENDINERFTTLKNDFDLRKPKSSEAPIVKLVSKKIL